MSRDQTDNLTLGVLDLIVISTDLDGNVTVFNSVAEETLGYYTQEIIGKEIPITNFESYKQNILAQTNTPNIAAFNDVNGNKIELELNTSSIKNQKGEITGLLFTATKPLRLAVTTSANDLPGLSVLELVLDRELRRLQRETKPLSLIKVDVDYFRAYKQQYGTTQTKKCLNDIAYVLQERIQRAGDLLAYGSIDEFYILLPNTDRSGAVTVAEHLRLMVAGLELENTASQVGTAVTISLGVVVLYPNDSYNRHLVLGKLEEALQQAKQDGRNCTRVIDLGQQACLSI